jgi:metal-responsive CopG/Arc/MetJ family transcriptional regulator
MSTAKGKKHTAIRLPHNMWKALEQAAEIEADSPSSLIRKAVDYYLTERHNINYRLVPAD